MNGVPPGYGNYSDGASAWSSKISGHTDRFEVTCPVERSGENELGLHGIGGNVWECCASDTSGGSFGAGAGGTGRMAVRRNIQYPTRNFQVGRGGNLFVAGFVVSGRAAGS